MHEVVGADTEELLELGMLLTAEEDGGGHFGDADGLLEAEGAEVVGYGAGGREFSEEAEDVEAGMLDDEKGCDNQHTGHRVSFGGPDIPLMAGKSSTSFRV